MFITVEELKQSESAEFVPLIRISAIAPSLAGTSNAGIYHHPISVIRYKGGSTYDIAHIAALLLSVKGAWIAGQMIRRWRCMIYEGFQIFNKI